MFDHCANGQQLKCLTVADEWTKEELAIEVGAGIRSARVIEVLSRLVSERGTPSYMRSDNGSEFVSQAVTSWIRGMGIKTALIDPGKPWQNAVGESFNGCAAERVALSGRAPELGLFRSRAEAKVIIEGWRRHFNEVRPHSSLGCLTPAGYAAKTEQETPASVQATGRNAADVGGPPRPVPLRPHPARKTT